MPAGCKGICNKLTLKEKCIGHRFYINGKKWCSVCDIFIKWDGLYCPCCRVKMRTRPESKKARLRFYKEKSQFSKLGITKSMYVTS